MAILLGVIAGKVAGALGAEATVGPPAPPGRV